MKLVYTEDFGTLIQALKDNGVPQEAIEFIERSKGYDVHDLQGNISIPGVEIQLIYRYVTPADSDIGYLCTLKPQYFDCIELYLQQERDK